MNKLFKTAFTLIELLVVIAIIGILSGLIVVTMNGVTAKANVAKSQVFSNSLRNALMLNLVSEWKFDGSGLNDGDNATTAYTQDTWSGGNNCTIAGTPKVKTTSNCVYGSCLQFNGSTDYLNCGSATYGSSGYTIGAWFKTTSSVDSDIFAGYVGIDHFNLLEIIGTTYKLRFLHRAPPGNSGGTSVYSNDALNNNMWHYGVATVIENSSQKLYVDGVLQADIKTPVGVYTSPISITIGDTGAFADRYFPGLIDDVKIFNSAVPVSQIKEQYYSGLNSLLINGNISKEEYSSRINNYASNN